MPADTVPVRSWLYSRCIVLEDVASFVQSTEEGCKIKDALWSIILSCINGVPTIPSSYDSTDHAGGRVVFVAGCYLLDVIIPLLSPGL